MVQERQWQDPVVPPVTGIFMGLRQIRVVDVNLTHLSDAMEARSQ
jgi:hypothetical protein